MAIAIASILLLVAVYFLDKAVFGDSPANGNAVLSVMPLERMEDTTTELVMYDDIGASLDRRLAADQRKWAAIHEIERIHREGR